MNSTQQILKHTCGKRVIKTLTFLCTKHPKLVTKCNLTNHPPHQHQEIPRLLAVFVCFFVRIILQRVVFHVCVVTVDYKNRMLCILWCYSLVSKHRCQELSLMSSSAVMLLSTGASTKLWICRPKNIPKKNLLTNGVLWLKSTLKTCPQAIFKKTKRFLKALIVLDF